MQTAPLPPASDPTWSLTQRVLDGTYTLNNPRGWMALVENAHQQDALIHETRGSVAEAHRLREQLAHRLDDSIGTLHAIVALEGLAIAALGFWIFVIRARART